MIQPDKHTNPKLSILNVAAIIIQELTDTEILKYDELLSSVIQRTDESAKELFVLANSFLFLLNKIEYFPDIDSLKIKNETD